jgi:hypothetical protein
MRQWQCLCGEWLDMMQSGHVHYDSVRQPSLGEMVQARLAGHDKDALTRVAEATTVKWSPDFPRRDKPNDRP